MIQSKKNLLAVATIATCVVALAPASVASAAPGLSKLGSSSSGVTFVDVQRVVSNPGDARFVPYSQNPVITGPNLYAPSAIKVGSIWNVYFGGFNGGSPTDDVYLETTSDDTFRSGFSSRTLMVGHGFYEHANDPSVVFNGGTFTMALSTAVSNVDQCSILTSADGVSWASLVDRRYEVAIGGASVANCARPSLNYNPATTRWEMYFDGEVNGGSKQQHLAISAGATPTNFTYTQAIGPWVDADIRRLANGSYIAAYRATAGPNPVWAIQYSTSADGRTWSPQVTLLEEAPLDGYDNCGVTNPGWVIEGSTVTALLYGGTSACSYDAHKIGVAYPQSEVTLKSGAILHVHREAPSPNSQIVATHDYVIDAISVRPDPSASPVIEQSMALTSGDVWSVDQRALISTARIGAGADSPHPSLPASNAIDGDTGTFFSSTSASQTTTAILAITIGAVQQVRGVTLTPRPSGYGFPIDFTVQYNDGAGWKPVPDQSYVGFANPGGVSVSLAFDEAVQASDIRLVTTRRSADDYGNFYLQLGEMAPLQ